jgi:lipoyl(octanoyl) transferase
MNSRAELQQYLKDHYPELTLSSFQDCLVAYCFPFDYQKFLSLQDELTKYVKITKDKVFICCNHSTLGTMGRGDRQNADSGNTSFIPTSLPVHQIKRGGGLTLHHPGQWIFYPIVKLDADKWTLTKHLGWMMALTREILADWGLEVIGKRNPLGVWSGDKKLASLGVGVNRFVSNHGLALNILPSELPADVFLALNPCGLNSNVYSSVSELVKTDVGVCKFQEDFLKLIGQKVRQGQLHPLPTQDCLL